MSADARCQQCGAPVAEGALFCSKCGADVTIVSPAEIATVEMSSLEPPAGRVRSTTRQMLRDATLGEYEILDELGRGGMATVFLAHDIALDRRVAIKVMAAHLLEGEGMAERFKLEARTAAQLSHPHIIPIYAVKETESSLFFVMKYVEGKPLDDIIKKLGPMPIPMVKDILTKVGSALGYAHRRNVIHRDVKPANVMIDEEGNPIMTDFGIAKVAEAKGLTMTGTTIGTPSYMSPEQCEAREVTGASDQYSLGIVAWEMLTGKVPFAGDSAVNTMYKQVHEELPPLRDFRPDVPQEVLDTVTRMLEKDPTDRWPSLEAAIHKLGAGTDPHLDPIRNQLLELARDTDPSELLAQLRTPGASLPGVAKGRTPAPAKAPRRRRATVIIAAALVIGIGGGALAVLRPWQPAPAGALDDGTSATPPSVGVADGSQDPAAEPLSGEDQTTTQEPATAEPEPTLSTPDVATAQGGGGVPEPSAGSPPPTTQPPPTRATVASVLIEDVPDRLEPGDEATFTAVALDGRRNALTDRRVEWASSNPSVGRITSAGVFTALSPGSTEVRARIEGAGTAQAITVAPPSIATLTLDRSSVTLQAGNRTTLAATGRSRSGSIVEGPIEWASSDPSVATVDDGAVVAVSEGSATISASAGGVTRTAAVTVTPAPVDTRTAIERLITAYARALESKDIEEVRKVYPDMTREQASAFQQSLPSTERADLTVESVSEDGDQAIAQVKGTYVFSNGRRLDSVPAEFEAVFRRVGGTWRLTETR